MGISIAALEDERAKNAELRKRIEDLTDKPHDGHNAGVAVIPRPHGTAGTNFSIQEAMGLSGSTKKYETYKGIQVRWAGTTCGRRRSYSPQRNLRDLAMNARINWEVPWAQVPARDKAKLFEVVSAVGIVIHQTCTTDR
jgi:hypothetical protein